MKPSLKIDPPVIAHRGASHYAPENTLAAFKKAAQLGIKWVEFDVMQAACDELIIFHDELLDRTTNGKGPVDQQPYSYLRTLDAGSWFNPEFYGERIPTLIQLIEFLEKTNMNANVEIKALPAHAEKMVIRVLEIFSHYSSAKKMNILFSSFSTDALWFLRKHSPTCQLGLLLHEWQLDWRELSQSLQCVSVHVNNDILTYESAQEVKELDKTLLCYTVNDPLRAQELFSFGVDAVFSDVPDLILKGIL